MIGVYIQFTLNGLDLSEHIIIDEYEKKVENEGESCLKKLNITLHSVSNCIYTCK